MIEADIIFLIIAVAFLIIAFKIVKSVVELITYLIFGIALFFIANTIGIL